MGEFVRYLRDTLGYTGQTNDLLRQYAADNFFPFEQCNKGVMDVMSLYGYTGTYNDVVSIFVREQI